MAICFEGELMSEWTKIGRTMRELGKRNEAATFLWDFLDFVVTHRTTLYILMQPFIFQKVKLINTYKIVHLNAYDELFTASTTSNI